MDGAQVADDYVTVGRVVGVFGVKGWVKVLSFTQPRENIANYDPWLLQSGGHWRPVVVEAVEDHGKSMVVKLDTVSDRDVAATLIGSEIAIYRQQLPQLERDEYYWHDLEGLTVVNQQSQILGSIVSLFETGANDVLVVKDQDGHTTLIPYLQGEVVIAIDLDAGQMQVDWDPELLS